MLKYRNHNSQNVNKKEAIVSAVAFFLLATGITSNAYLHLRHIEKGDYISIGNEKVYIDDIFETCGIMTFEVNEKGVMKNYTGALLSDIINMSHIENPQEHKYVIIASDGYQKTVEWKDMMNGIITEEKRIIFPNLPRAFWIRDVIKIEVM